ncbi:bifunctional adenosylcobinamide kinase/adenosylcobinamide-phosphate guanylyltransferase [Halobacillus sp. Marseille-Q1614]|uniref:bifunctional adenosylcobinamide kinase/adenosylcobinamide-phosphate guanylyltransferase n=1 Tax=Halobacillus sp. Marseille-Q1614 TaxID=2709134 RepID=UPI00156EC51F|nr:bifunctional adenosylcobinamide kinase/adenosylcobinamide-phosphate guanylyltransferase [Halobacillus sp. Marseille-Q1614]
MLTFISGGARCGKSSFAEKQALASCHSQKNGKLYYVATSMTSDEEMEARISRHRLERGEEWQTIEAPAEVQAALEKIEQGSTVLIDCLTVWLSNKLFINQSGWKEIFQEVSSWTAIARQQQLHLYIVSNDLNEGIPSDMDSVKSYVYMLEQLHQCVITAADEVYQVIAGIPEKWKGG